jgi:hypothetical protein
MHGARTRLRRKISLDAPLVELRISPLVPRYPLGPLCAAAVFTPPDGDRHRDLAPWSISTRTRCDNGLITLRCAFYVVVLYRV